MGGGRSRLETNETPYDTGNRDRGDWLKQATSQATLTDAGVGIALAHRLAPVRALEMHAVALGGSDELADLFEAFGRQPALAPAPLHGETVGGLLVGSAELMAALVGVNPHLHRGRDPRQQLGI